MIEGGLQLGLSRVNMRKAIPMSEAESRKEWKRKQNLFSLLKNNSSRTFESCLAVSFINVVLLAAAFVCPFK
jgi:hypothetical protein